MKNLRIIITFEMHLEAGFSLSKLLFETKFPIKPEIYKTQWLGFLTRSLECRFSYLLSIIVQGR